MDDIGRKDKISWLWRSNGCGDQYVDLNYHNPLLVEAVLKLFLRTNPIPCEDHGLSPGAFETLANSGTCLSAISRLSKKVCLLNIRKCFSVLR